MYWLIKKSYIRYKSLSVLQCHCLKLPRFDFEIIYMQRI